MTYTPVKKRILARLKADLRRLEPGVCYTMLGDHFAFQVISGARVPAVRNQLKAARPHDYNLFAVTDCEDGAVLIYPSALYESGADLLGA